MEDEECESVFQSNWRMVGIDSSVLVSFLEGMETVFLEGSMTKYKVRWVQFSPVSQSCSILCDPMDCHTPGLPVHHQLPELAQTHVR